MDDKQFMCGHCGNDKRYIRSNSKAGLYLNSVITTYKQSGLVSTLLFIIAGFLHAILTLPYNVKKWFRLQRMIQAGKQIDPPWIAFPTIPHGSIGWRMGDGETFLMTWDRWYRKISKDQQLEYQVSYPEPDSWNGFYKSREAQ
ncbi:MAG: hypothetical protein OEW15_17150 [Nitrospirota bacterium]|nr:hypothetical protein [Nitrospirota bacterium]